MDSKQNIFSSSKNTNKKGINAIVTTCFIIAGIVILVIGYDLWFTSHIEKRYSEIETIDQNANLIHDVIGSTLYLSNPYKENITIIKVTIEGKDCGISNSIATPGMNQLDVLSCASKIHEPAVEAVVYTNKHVFAKHVYINKIRIPEGAILGGTDCEQLNKIRENLNGRYFLMGNLYCFNTVTWGPNGFTPIGSLINPFTGTLDGNGYSIYDIYINTNENYIGLFSATQNAIISNIGLLNFSITGGRYTGALTGYAQNTTFSNIDTNLNLSSDEKYSGAISGFIEDSIIENTFTSGTLVSNEKNLGGLVGIAQNSTIKNSYSHTNINNAEKYTGSLVGILNNSQVINSYAKGTINSSEEEIGGLIGLSINSIVTDSYWDIDVSQLEISAGGIGYRTPQMQNISTYATWDTNIWQISNGTYPTLK